MVAVALCTSTTASRSAPVPSPRWLRPPSYAQPLPPLDPPAPPPHTLPVSGVHAACVHACMFCFMHTARTLVCVPLGSGGFLRHFRIRYSRRNVLWWWLSRCCVLSCRPFCEHERKRPRPLWHHPARPAAARTSQRMAVAQARPPDSYHDPCRIQW